MKIGLLYEKHQETKMEPISNQLVVPWGAATTSDFCERRISLGAKITKVEYSRTSFGQDYARTSLDSAVPVMCAIEQSRRVLSRPLGSMPLIDSHSRA